MHCRKPRVGPTSAVQRRHGTHQLRTPHPPPLASGTASLASLVSPTDTQTPSGDLRVRVTYVGRIVLPALCHRACSLPPSWAEFPKFVGRLKKPKTKKVVYHVITHPGHHNTPLPLIACWMYRRRSAKVGGVLYDGAPSAWVAEEFRTRFKAGIQTIIARTAGRIMASTGIPGPSLDKAAHDAVRWALNCLIWLSFMYFELYLCLVRHLCAMHARQSFCKVEG
jgi:hypothetical protein